MVFGNEETHVMKTTVAPASLSILAVRRSTIFYILSIARVQRCPSCPARLRNLDGQINVPFWLSQSILIISSTSTKRDLPSSKATRALSLPVERFSPETAQLSSGVLCVTSH